MTERKTDILNLRLDPALAREVDRIADWRGKTASEVARDLLHYGITVERELEAQELKRGFQVSPVDRAADDVRINVHASYHFLSRRELAEIDAAANEEVDQL